MAKRGRPTKVASILKKMSAKPFTNDNDNSAPMIIPNHSGDHSAGNTGTPTNDNDIANKAYVDNNAGLWEVDGTETQLKTADAIDMQTNKIINVTDPTLDQDAATKKYVDDNIPTTETLAQTLAAGNTTSGQTLTISAADTLLVTPTGAIATNNIVPTTAALGVTIDEATILDGDVLISSGNFVRTDTISETTSANGVNIDSVNLKDGGGTFSSAVGITGDLTINTGNSILGGNVTVGEGSAGVDYTLTFDGETSDGVITWLEDEADFQFDNTVVVKKDNAQIELWSNDFLVARLASVSSSGSGLDRGFLSLFDGASEVIRARSNGDSWMGQSTGKIQLGINTNTPAEALHVTDNQRIDGDLYFVGAGSGIPYGGMYTNTTITVTIGTATVPVEIGDTWTTGETNLVTFGASHYLTVTKAGRYKIDYSVSLAQNSPSAAIQLEVGIMKNGTADTTIGRVHRTVANSSDIGAAGSTGIISLAADDQISLYVTNETNTTNIDVEHANLTLIQVGG